MFRCKILSFYDTWIFFTYAASHLYVTLCAALVLRQAAGKTHGNRAQTCRAARALRRSAAKVPAAEQKGMDHMNNFNLFTPTKVVFGKDTESQTGALVKAFGGQNPADVTENIIHWLIRTDSNRDFINSIEKVLD